MSGNRAGTIPAGDMVSLCFSGKYTEKEIRGILTGHGGLYQYLGESNTLKVEQMIAQGDVQAKEVYDAMLYQVGKQIGAFAAAAKGRVDAIILTGGMANSEYVCQQVKEYVSFLAPVVVYPGEIEMESIGKYAWDVLMGREAVKEV